MPTPPHTQSTLVKIGGALVGDAAALATFWEGVAHLHTQGPVIVVHGGGPQLTAAARRLGHEPRIVHGRRVTTDIDLEILQGTVRGVLNMELVAGAQRAGLAAVGIAGADGGVLRVTRRPPWQIDGESVDFGHVGDVKQVETRLLDVLLDGGFVPVVAPLGIDSAGRLYNVNADTVACMLAAALNAAQFLMVTEAGGVRSEPDDPTTLLAHCDATTFAEGQEAGWIQGGMRVKLKVAFDALNAGVHEVYICAPDDLVARVAATHVVH